MLFSFYLVFIIGVCCFRRYCYCCFLRVIICVDIPFYCYYARINVTSGVFGAARGGGIGPCPHLGYLKMFPSFSVAPLRGNMGD